MFGNILILIVLIALVVLFAWLTVRAVSAKRLWIKIAGGIGAGLLTLLFVAVAFMGAKGIAATYFPAPPAAPRPERGRHAGADRPRRVPGQPLLHRLSRRGRAGRQRPPAAAAQRRLEHRRGRGVWFHGGHGGGEPDPRRQAGRLQRRRAVPRPAPQHRTSNGHRLGFMAFLPYGQLSNR